MNIKDVLEEYADLKESEKQIKEKLSEINPVILSYMEDNKAEEVNLENRGTFVLVTKRNWKYPAELEEKEKKIKEEKKKAERTGEAEYNESYYLKFSPIKKESNE